ncbi:Iron-uptake system permease protein FeuC [compost metagenome]
MQTDRTRILLIVASVCMIAIATATTGPIAFVSFLAGPIAKRMVGVGFSGVIPAGLVGVVLVLAADLIGQFAFVTRFPVGVITGLLGAPYLIYLLIQMNRKGEL